MIGRSHGLRGRAETQGGEHLEAVRARSPDGGGGGGAQLVAGQLLVGRGLPQDSEVVAADSDGVEPCSEGRVG